MAKGRILAIDDEQFFRHLYRDLLGAEGYAVRTVASREEGLAALRREEFDLVITGLGTEGTGGLDVTESIRRFNPDQEIMVVTGDQEVSLAVEAMKRGVAEYLLKPLNPDEFLLVVNRLLFLQTLRVEHRKLIAENIEFHAQLAAYQRCLSFLRTHDLDRLGDLILDTLMDLLRAEGAILWLADFGGNRYRVRCRRGLARVAAGEEMVHPDEVEQRLFWSGEPALIGAGEAAWVPLVCGPEPVALVRVEAPTDRSAFNRRDLRLAALAGEFAASALHNVLRGRDLEHNSLRATRSQAYGMPFFRDHGAMELHKARRYGRDLSIIKLLVTNYAELGCRFLDRELEEGLARIMETVGASLRDADILAMAGPDEFYILLPETDYWGSLVTQKRIRKALRGKLALCDMRKSHPVEFFMRAASFPADGEALEALMTAAGARLERLQKSLYRRGSLAELPFWTVVNRLLGEVGDYGLEDSSLRVSPRLADFEAPPHSRFCRMPESRLEELMQAFTREVVESRRVRGSLYRGCSDFGQVRQSLLHLEGVEGSATSLFLLGGGRRVTWEYQRIQPIFIDDERFARFPFLLYLNEDYAYGLFARRHEGELIGFHTADFYFVENMIALLQEQYRLQEGI